MLAQHILLGVQDRKKLHLYPEINQWLEEMGQYPRNSLKLTKDSSFLHYVPLPRSPTLSQKPFHAEE